MAVSTVFLFPYFKALVWSLKALQNHHPSGLGSSQVDPDLATDPCQGGFCSMGLTVSMLLPICALPLSVITLAFRRLSSQFLTLSQQLRDLSEFAFSCPNP